MVNHTLTEISNGGSDLLYVPSNDRDPVALILRIFIRSKLKSNSTNPHKFYGRFTSRNHSFTDLDTERFR